MSFLRFEALDKAGSPNFQQPLMHPDLIALGLRFVAWFDKLFYQPHGEPLQDAWLPSQLEYQFECSAPEGSSEKVFSVKEYYHGHLDWYNFSVDRDTETLGVVESAPMPGGFDALVIRSSIPTPIQFDATHHRRRPRGTDPKDQTSHHPVERGPGSRAEKWLLYR